MFDLITWFCLVNLCVISQGALISNATIRRDLNFTELVAYDGYTSEEHTVTTSDGYILTIFHVPPKQGCRAVVGVPIVLMHGLYLSADDWIVPGPGRAHCYLYADQCRDVWLFNSRGNLYSRGHVSLDPDKDAEYWNFDWFDMALYDLPPSIDYVLNKTGSSKVAYVSHSQGAACLVYLCAKIKEMNDKILVGFGLSMTAFLYHARFVVIKAQGEFSPALTAAIDAGYNTEIVPRGGFYQPIAKTLCGTTDISYLPCSNFYFALLGYDNFQLTEDVLKTLTGHLPSGTSLKNFNLWGKIYKYGFTENFGANNQTIDLTNVTMKWIMVTSENDYVSDPKDVDMLIPLMPDATKCVLSDTSFGHLDYLFGKSIPTLITPMITRYVDTGIFKCL